MQHKPIDEIITQNVQDTSFPRLFFVFVELLKNHSHGLFFIVLPPKLSQIILLNSQKYEKNMHQYFTKAN